MNPFLLTIYLDKFSA